MKKYLIKYGFEFVVIFLGILISLYFEQSRQNRIENDRKNKSIEQLIKVIDQDISQIDNFITLQEISLESCLVLYDNLNHELILSNDSPIPIHIAIAKTIAQGGKTKQAPTPPAATTVAPLTVVPTNRVTPVVSAIRLALPKSTDFSLLFKSSRHSPVAISGVCPSGQHSDLLCCLT